MLLAKCSVYETYSSSFNLGMDNSIRFVSAACLVWKVACPFLLHVAYCFFSPLRTCFTHTPQSFSRSVYVLCWSSSLAGSFSVILTCSELGMGKTAQKCRKIRAFPSHLGVILSFLLTFLILPFPPSLSNKPINWTATTFNQALIHDVVLSTQVWTVFNEVQSPCRPTPKTNSHPKLSLPTCSDLDQKHKQT